MKIKSVYGKTYEIISDSDGGKYLKDSAGGEYDVLPCDDEAGIDRLISAVDMSEYILKPLDRLVFNGQSCYCVRRLKKGFIPLTTYLDNADKYVDIPFSNICDAAINLIDNFQILHYYNLAYCGITADEVFISIKTGQTVLGGCEKLQRPGECALHDRQPDYFDGLENDPVTFGDDYFAMFTLLFKLFYLSRPTAVSPASRAAYIFADPELERADEFANAFLYRRLYPSFVSDAFDNFFRHGASVGEVEMKEVITRLKASIITCPTPGCRAENFFENGRELHCWKCAGAIVPVVAKIEGGTNVTVVLTEGCTISRNDVFHDGVMNEFVGRVVRNPKDRKMFGIKNLLPYAVSFTKKNGTVVDLQPNEAAPIAEGVVIEYAENVHVRIEQAGETGENGILAIRENSVSIFRGAAEAKAIEAARGGEIVPVAANEAEVYDA